MSTTFVPSFLHEFSRGFYSVGGRPRTLDTAYRFSDSNAAKASKNGDDVAQDSVIDACDPQGVHLLCIFPLRDLPAFARLTCIAVCESATPCGPPFCASRREVLTHLVKFLPAERVSAILADLDSKVEVQLTISDKDARNLGFMAWIM